MPTDPAAVKLWRCASANVMIDMNVCNVNKDRKINAKTVAHGHQTFKFQKSIMTVSD
jgi:hypothetical protein